MNNYSAETRKRGRSLLVVEGKHEKDELFGLLFHCFPEIKITMDEIWIYGTNIYMLYEDIVKEYGEEWEEDDIDLPFVISKKQQFQSLCYKEDFTNIILVFDYERHDTNFSEDKIVRMQRCFVDSTNMGKLYINYPMIESYQHLDSLPDKEYAERKIPVSMQPGKEYKALVRKNTAIGKFFEFPHKIDDLLKEHFQILDTQKRERCCSRIFSIHTEEQLEEQIQEILNGVIKHKWEKTAKYQIKNMVQRMEYAHLGQNYWQFMRNLFQQIVLHNICKANQIQYNTYFIGPGEYKAAFERIDLNEILKKQNLVSRYSQAGFIWVLCTCVFFIAEYHFSLIIDP